MKYTPIWEELKKNTKVEVVVHESIAKTVLQGIKKTKSAENATRSAVGLVPYSKLVVKKELLSEKTRMVKISLRLLYDIRL